MHRTSARLAALVAALLGAASAHAGTIGDPEAAALQVALRGQGLYAETIDGLVGPATRSALAAFERNAGLRADGRLDARAARALGRPDRRPLGARALSLGSTGWDVAALQFLLAWHGFPSGAFDGDFGERLDASLRGFQAWAGLPADGVAGRATFAALRRAPAASPLGLRAPVRAPLGDRFGPRGDRFHGGLDFPAPTGTRVRAAAPGVVVQAGFDAGGHGKLVVVDHGEGVLTYYAHLSRIRVEVGQAVGPGDVVGRVGSTGHSTGPHLHFEVRVRGAQVDPLPRLG